MKTGKIILSSLIVILCAFTLRENPATKKKEFSIVSKNSEVFFGQSEYSSFIAKLGGAYPNEKVQAYVQQVGKKIAKVSDRPDLPYEFTVVKSPIANAYCFPGGKIVINTGMLSRLKNEAQLAAVLAHEIAHANARHLPKAIEREIFWFPFRDFGSFLPELVFLSFDRNQELEADYYSIRYLSRAGYDTKSALAAEELLKKKSSSHNWLFSTHPKPEERLAIMKKGIKDFPLNKGYKGQQEFSSMTKRLS